MVEAVAQFDGGMNDRLAKDRIATNEYFYGENVEIRDGDIKTRRGSRLLREKVSGEQFQGIGVYRKPFATAFKETMLIAQGQKIYRYEYPFEPVSMTLPSTLVVSDPVHFIQALTYTYIFRGDTRKVWRWNGNIGSDIEVVPGAEVLDTMFGARTGIYAYNRIWTISELDQLNVYDTFSEEIDLANNTTNITKADGQRLVALQDFEEGRILAFKERSILLISGANGIILNASQDLSIDRVEETFGCTAEHSIVQVGIDVFFLSQRGVMTIQLTVDNKAQAFDLPLSLSIENLINRINTTNVHKSSAILFDNYYLLAVPIDQSEQPNAILAYDLEKRKWAGIWRWRDSTGALYNSSGDAIFRFSRLFLYRYGQQTRAQAAGFEGEVLHLLSSPLDKDFVLQAGDFYITLGPGSFSFPAVYNQTTIESQTSGAIEFGFRLSEALSSSGIFFSLGVSAGPGGGPSALLVEFDENLILTFRTAISGVDQWSFSTNQGFSLGEWHVLSLIQDGTAPVLYIDTIVEDITFSVSTDKTVWFNDFPTPFTSAIMAGFSNFQWGLSYLSIQDYDGTAAGSGRRALVAHFPLNEGTGTLVTASNDSNITGSLSTATWSVPTPESEIYSTIITRSLFRQDGVNVKAHNGELTFRHRDPKLTFSFQTPNKVDQVEFTDKVYDETKYDTAGHIDYATSNTNLDHDDDGRKNYSPLTVPQAGITIPDTGITLNREVERTEFLFADILASRLNAKIENKQGNFALKEVVMNGSPQQFGNKAYL